MILILIRVIMMLITGSTMSGHFIVKFVVREREVGEVLQRIGNNTCVHALDVAGTSSRLVRTIVMILILIRVIMMMITGSTMSGHFIAKLLFGSARLKKCFSV